MSTVLNALLGLGRDAVIVITHADASVETTRRAEQFSDVWIQVSGPRAVLRKNPVGPVAQGPREEVLECIGAALSRSAQPQNEGAAGVGGAGGSSTAPAPCDDPLQGGTGLFPGPVDAQDAVGRRGAVAISPVHLFLDGPPIDSKQVFKLFHVCRDVFDVASGVGGAGDPVMPDFGRARWFNAVLIAHGVGGSGTLNDLPPELVLLEQLADLVVINGTVRKCRTGVVGVPLMKALCNPKREGAAGDGGVAA